MGEMDAAQRPGPGSSHGGRSGVCGDLAAAIILGNLRGPLFVQLSVLFHDYLAPYVSCARAQLINGNDDGGRRPVLLSGCTLGDRIWVAAGLLDSRRLHADTCTQVCDGDWAFPGGSRDSRLCSRWHEYLCALAAGRGRGLRNDRSRPVHISADTGWNTSGRKMVRLAKWIR